MKRNDGSLCGRFICLSACSLQPWKRGGPSLEGWFPRTEDRCSHNFILKYPLPFCPGYIYHCFNHSTAHGFGSCLHLPVCLSSKSYLQARPQNTWYVAAFLHAATYFSASSAWVGKACLSIPLFGSSTTTSLRLLTACFRLATAKRMVSIDRYCHSIFWFRFFDLELQLCRETSGRVALQSSGRGGGMKHLQKQRTANRRARYKSSHFQCGVVLLVAFLFYFISPFSHTSGRFEKRLI